MTISFSSIFSKCQMLTSYESGRGESAALYEKVHLQDRDKTVVNDYAKNTVAEIEASMRFAIASISYSTTDITINIVNGFSTNQREDNWLELVVLGVMSAWLEGKIEDRAKAYRLMFNEMLKAMTRTITKKRPELLNDY